MELQFLDVEADYDRVARSWQVLCAQAPHGYYLSWGWMETWLASLRNRRVNVELVLVRDRGEIAAGFFLGRRQLVRQRWLRSRGVLLNATGVRAYDAIAIEFNGLLARPGFSWRLRDLVDALPGDWQELILPGLDHALFPGNALEQSLAPMRQVVLRDEHAYFVDLEAVRRRGDYLGLLGRSTRSQIRRSFRRYGEVELETAATQRQAEQFFDEMVALHRDAWAARPTRSRFVSDYVLGFHRALIDRRFRYGEIQLVRLKTGERTLGVLYNFVYRGRVYNYQSGIRYDDDNRLKPGLMCHAEAVAHNAANGAGTYEFLAGDSRYKRSLATDARRLTWVRLQKPHPRFWLERQLRAFKPKRGRLTLPVSPN